MVAASDFSAGGRGGLIFVLNWWEIIVVADGYRLVGWPTTISIWVKLSAL